MSYSEISNVPNIYHDLGVNNAIISPGSRNAPLTIAFARHSKINCKVIPDERSAAFIAVGIAQQLKEPVVLICTSGSASLNYAPAVAEAYFSQTPLLILTADRPPEWIDQYDGQTIRQEDVYGKHVKRSFRTPVDLSHIDAVWHMQRIISESFSACQSEPMGPVHVNIPFREPFYPSEEFETSPYKVSQQTNSHTKLSETEREQLKIDLNKFDRKLIICGQADYSKEELTLFSELSHRLKIPVVGDVISNIHDIEESVVHHDVFLSSKKSGLPISLKPDLLITFGKSVLSKSLKHILRLNSPKEHWHIQIDGQVADTYKALTRHLKTSNGDFLSVLNEIEREGDFDHQKQENYYHIWQIEERKVERLFEQFFPKEPLGEFEFVYSLINALPPCNLHLANSMSVRYANFVGLKNSQSVKVYSNRGTSGIDGCNSTALGHSLASEKLNILITGDLAFLYDRNAFWHNYSFSNLRIVVLNNHGGGIFRIIKGPSSLPELNEYFEIEQKQSAKYVAEEYGMEYLKCDKRSKIKNYLKNLFEESDRPKILEIETKSEENKKILEEFRAAFDTIK